MEDKWYAIFVLTGKEDNVKARLDYQFEDKPIYPIVPKRKIKERKEGKWHIKIKTMFPGYVLIYGTLTVKDYYVIRQEPETIKMLKEGTEFIEIPHEEIELIDRIFKLNNGIAEFSKVTKVGDQIQVIDGPLKGYEGKIESFNLRKQRARIKIFFAGEERFVDLGIEYIKN